MKVINKLPSLLLKSTLRLKRKILGENRIVIVATTQYINKNVRVDNKADMIHLEDDGVI